MYKFTPVLISTLLILTSCSSVKKVPFKGSLIGQSVQTTLDSDEAVAFAKSEAKVYQGNERSLDIETIEIVRDVFNRNIRLHEKYRKAFNSKVDAVNVLSNGYVVLFIPGFMYKSDNTTGADFKKQRDLFNQFGVENKLLNTKENGLVEENAKIISSFISKSHQDKKLILVSASKGGLETAVALGKYLKQGDLNKVIAWISIGGIHRGTYLADHAQTFPKSIFARIVAWIEGFKFSQIEDMSVSKNEKLFKTLSLPRNIYFLQFIGVPLSGQVSDEIESRYYELSKYGPNDGLTTIEHELLESGRQIIELGLDHYYRDPNIDKKTLALFLTALSEINKK